MSAKENINGNNLLLYYVDRMNKTKGIKKYFNYISKEQIDKYADTIIRYLNQFQPDFICKIKTKINEKIND